MNTKTRLWVTRLASLLLISHAAVSSGAIPPNTLTDAERKADWKLLFDGEFAELPMKMHPGEPFPAQPQARHPSCRSCFRWLLLVCLVLRLPASAQSTDAAARRAFGGIQAVISPDGTTIALSFQGNMARMPAAGGTLTRLTREAGWDVEPAWSPDAQRIAYVNTAALSVGPLRMISAEECMPVALPKSVLARGRLQFHPDGQRLLTRWPARIYGLCWDAQGKGAFVVTDRGGSLNDLWHLPLDGSLEHARRITFGQTDEDWPSLSADGHWLSSGHGLLSRTTELEPPPTLI